jgi:hypothetical protein
MKTTLPIVIGFISILSQPVRNHYIRLVQPLTRDLDEVMVEITRAQAAALGYKFGK